MRGLHFHTPEQAQRFVEYCRSRYLLLGYKLNSSNTVRVSPPLNVGEEELEIAIAIMRSGFHVCSAAGWRNSDG